MQELHGSKNLLVDLYIKIRDLILNGLKMENKVDVFCKVKIILDMFCCDSPAKLFVLKVEGNSGYCVCTVSIHNVVQAIP